MRRQKSDKIRKPDTEGPALSLIRLSFQNPICHSREGAESITPPSARVTRCNEILRKNAAQIRYRQYIHFGIATFDRYRVTDGTCDVVSGIYCRFL